MASRRLEVVIAGNASGATRALGQLENRSERTSRAMSGLRRVGGALAGVFAGVQIGQFLRGAIAEAEEAQTVMAQTNAVIESTGGVAGITAGHLQRMSARLSELAGVDDEVIQQGGNLLLTFRNISAEGGIYDEALASALDMSAALGTQLQPNIMAVGRALNDPVAGLSRLTRMGVSFTQAQKDQVAAMMYFGDTAGAQRIILEELAAEFGGAAEANATASGRMRVAWENLQEQVGTGLLPVVEQLADGLASVNDGFTQLSGPVQRIVVGIGLVAAAAGAAAAIFSSVWAGVAVAAVAAVGLEIYGVWRLTQPLRNLFFAVVGQLREWWNQSKNIRATMAAIGVQALSGLRSALGWVVTAFQAWWSLTAPVRGVLNVIGSIGLYALRGAISNVVTLLRIVWAITGPVRSVLSFIGGLAWGALRSAISAVAGHLREAWNASEPLRGTLATIGGFALSALRSAVESIRSGFERIGSILDSIASKIRNLPTPSSLLSSLPGFAVGTLAAPAGMAWVGERGPELVRFRGGERVYTAGQSRSMTRNTPGQSADVDTGPIVIHTHVNLDGEQIAESVSRTNRRWNKGRGDT